MADIVITEFMDDAAVASLARDFELLYAADLVDRPADLRAALGDCRALVVRNRTRVTAELLAAAPALRIVGRLGVGLDNIDLDTCSARGIEVCPATGANDLAVAEYVIASALVLLRRAYQDNAAMLAGQWPRHRLIGRELAGRCVGLVGFGGIAREVAVRAQALGAVCLAFDPYLPEGHAAWDLATRRSLADLLAGADIVSLHVPLTPETRHLLDAAALATMRADAILINAARGGIVDEVALAAALRAGRLAGAALDVFETEPLSEAAAAVFRDIPNLILTPHIAGVTVESNERVSAVIAAHVRRILSRS